MTRFHFLTALSDKIAKDFLTPLVMSRRRLREQGQDIRIHYDLNDILLDCDVLCVVSSFVRKYQNNVAMMARLKMLIQKTSRCFFFDVNDSTGAFYRDFFPLVERYYKKQLLRDRTLYLQELYSGRYFFDYYHKHYKLTPEQKQLASVNVGSADDLKKIRLSWNVGLGDYFRYPRLMRPWMHRLSFYFRDPKQIQLQGAERKRPIDVLGCFSTYTKSESAIHFHRSEVSKKLKELPKQIHQVSDFLPSGQYYRALRNAKLIVCPFGYGEISWKDFEAFINGAVVLKPKMDFMETWPNYYQEGKTYLPFKWDFSDFQERVEAVLDNPGQRKQIAAEGQRFYFDTVNEKGKEAFSKRFQEIMN